ncbi:glycosyltransferase family 10 domain-containing protein [Dokdonia sp. R86516]|uniref:glycosyltransferase family 10 domain-containing protein n=1 Tax=Dokdonia sp. R86516 TaxID=3093856 RepID=UPI0037CA2A1B
MKPTLKLNFVDFWSGFDPKNNLFTKLLVGYYDITIAEDPDFVFFSCYGNDYLKYNCPRLFYTAENRVTPRFAADYSITFEFSKSSTQYYFPYYAYGYLFLDKTAVLTKLISKSEASEIWNKKNQFCCTVVSNPNGIKRNAFFDKLNARKKVNSGGKYKNNVGGAVSSKREFIELHKFVFAFENQSYPGYVTEKITDALESQGIPIYYGDPQVGNDFNKKRFLSFEDYKSMDDLIDYILEIYNDEEAYTAIISEPIFTNNELPEYLDSEKLLAFLKWCINDSKSIVPKGQTYKRQLHNTWLLIRRGIKKVPILRRTLLIQYR